jgi:hypothetical protein
MTARRHAFPAAAASVLSAVVLASTVYAYMSMGRFDIGESDFIPSPRLIRPSTDVVDLRGTEALEFSWSPHEGDPTQRDCYDFRLYKGDQAFGPALIFKMRLPPRQWSIWISADLFEDGAMYTCTLRQVYVGSARSRRTFWSFRVIKR